MQVEPRFKPEVVECPCGCGLVGHLRKKIWAGETTGHVKRCVCRRCAGGRTKSRASARERRLAVKTGGQRELMSGAMTGRDVTTGRGTWVEETANVALVRGFFSWFDSKQIAEKTRRIRDQHVAPWAFTVVRGRRSYTIQATEDWVEKETS